MKTSELTGAALDWAVGKATGLDVKIGMFGPLFRKGYKWAAVGAWRYTPSADWAKGGPIIEREGISVQQFDGSSPAHKRWNAYIGSPPVRAIEEINGPTPLIAAMRCFVAMKLGDEVDVPKELSQ